MLYIEIPVVLLLILFNGALAMSELAVVSARTTRLRQMAAEGNSGAKRAIALIEDPGRFLSTVQIGITLVGIFSGAFSGVTLGRRIGEWLDTIEAIAPYGNTIGVAIVVVAITYLTLIIGELVPKRIALANPEHVASLVAPPMQFLARVAGPPVWLLKVSSDAVVRMLGLSGRRESGVSEEEVRALIAEGTRVGVFVPQERDMIDAILRLADRDVRAIMTPRTEVAWIDASAGREEIAEAYRRHRLSRMLVCEGSVDEPIGVIHAKDVLPVVLRGEKPVLDDLIHAAPIVPDRTPVFRLLDRFKRERVHLAIVVDEYGSTEGIVTVTDILESIAGELPELGEPPERMFLRRDDGSWLVDGAMPIDEFERKSGMRGLVALGDFNTVAGLILHLLGRLPDTGESVSHGGRRFEVVDMDGRRIDKVLVSPIAPGEDEEEPASG